MPRLVQGVGILDNESPVRNLDGQKILWEDPAYTSWKSILKRVYSKAFKEKHPSYKMASLCLDWVNFSCFKSWWDRNHYGGKLVVDKDIIKRGNKHYSPENCCLVPQALNSWKIRGVKPLSYYAQLR